MATSNTDTSASTEPTTLETTADFDPPTGFAESYDPPNNIRGNTAQVFVERDGRGYVVLKQLTNASGDQFWHVEEWHYTGDYYRRETSYAATSRDEVLEYMESAASTIRTVEPTNSSFH